MRELTIEEFVEKTATEEPVPGGGSVSAVCGAMSASLTMMVANLTIGKKKYQTVSKEMEEILSEASLLKNNLLDLIQQDCEAFEKVMAALALSKETEEEKATRKESLERALKKAAEVPYLIAEKSYQVMPLAKKAVLYGNQNAITDGLISAMTARTAVLAALLNVRINLKSIRDVDYNEIFRKKVEVLENKTVKMEEEIRKVAGKI
jgi:formiminotetrahydrofolate cyclodeaminase